MRLTGLTILLTTAVVLMLDTAPARALQLVSNFGFDDDLAGWSTCCALTGTVTWDAAQDHFGSALSGSAKLAHLIDPPNGSMTLSACLSGPDVVPGKKLLYGTSLRFAPGETTPGQLGIAITFLTGANCTGSSISGSGRAANTSDVVRGEWVTVKQNPGSATTVPAGAQSVNVTVALTKSLMGTLTVDVDDVWVAAVGTPFCDGLPATQAGGPTPDFINGTDKSDVIVGKGSIDWIDGHEGNDHLCGGPGNDVLYGGPGDDRLFGEGGQDTLQGAEGDDLLYGAGNNDTLEGGTGSDVLRGGSGFDTCTDTADGTSSFRKCEKVAE